MKKIYIAFVLMLNLQSIIYSAQESKYDVGHKRQDMINDAVKNFPYLTQGFDFLRNQHLIDTTFHDFLGHNISHDEHEDEDMNFDLMIIDAEDIITNNMKYRFLQTLCTAMIEKKNLDQFDHALFLYVMEHKDTTMHNMVRLWLYEWSNIQNEDGNTQLHLAVLINSTEIARMLIDARANLNIQNNYGNTQLHLAAYCYNHTEIARMLIAKGANVNLQDKDGETPLHWAARYNKKIVRMLILAHADLTNQNRLGETPFYIAARRNNIEIAYMLIVARININFVLFDFEKMCDLIIVLNSIILIITIVDHMDFYQIDIADNIDSQAIMAISMSIMFAILHSIDKKIAAALDN